MGEETIPVDRAVKFVGRDTIEGLAIPFDTFDTDGERFTKATDFCDDWFSGDRPVLYNHGLDSAHRATKVGSFSEWEERESGRWVQTQLAANAKYRKRIDELIERGALGYSSGAYGHLATKTRQGDIVRWPWVENSLTPIPAHPLTLGVHYIKAGDFLDLIEDDVPIPVAAALKALDGLSSADEDDGLPAGLKFAEHADRLLADVEAFRDRAGSLVELRAKSGRVLSTTTRERLSRHPSQLRELADDLDGLLSEADAEKIAGKAQLDALHLETERVLSRLLGVPLT